MKAISYFTKYAVGRSLVLAVAATIWFSGTAQAQIKGGERLTRLTPLKTVADIAAVAPGDTMVMSCPKCQDIWVTVVQPPDKGGRTDSALAQQHQCPGCATKIVSEGQGKTAAQKVKHLCKHCGSEAAYCCVMKKGAGPTKGMEGSAHQP